VDVVRLLIEKGADVNLRTSVDQTPLNPRERSMSVRAIGLVLLSAVLAGGLGQPSAANRLSTPAAPGLDRAGPQHSAAAWSPMPSGTTQSLVGVWGASRQDLFAVGAKGTILHFDGRVWAPMPVEGAPHLVAVWGASGRDVFATGDAGVILHYDGKSWTSMPANAKVAQGKTGLLTRPWGSGPNDVFVAGFDGVLLHYDGRAWTPISTGTTQDLNAVWGFSPEDVFVVGGGGTILHYGR